MSRTRCHFLVGILSLVIFAFCGSLALAEMRSRPLPGSKFVNVNVAFTMQLPLADESQRALTATQKRGRKLIYEFARDECAVLREAIAKVCRLTHLQVSTQIRRQQNQMPLTVYLNGSARFTISLKDAGAVAQ